MARARQKPAGESATRILDVAERLVQSRGFNGFSYADIAAELEITTASLHYHFPGKGELGRALIGRYTERFADALDAIDDELADGPEKLAAYGNLYAAVLREKRLCLCGMLAAEFHTLPEGMREAVLAFFETNEKWLARVLGEGRDGGRLRFSGSPEGAARMIVGGLEGAMLVARPYDDVARFEESVQQLLGGLTIEG